MGRSVFAFLVQSQEDIKAVRELEAKHNSAEDAGESFVAEAEYLLHFKQEYWLNLMNMGGGSLSATWLRKHKPAAMVILYPFGKPKEWDTCEDVVFDKKKIDRVLSELPATSTTTSTTRPDDRPFRPVRDDIFDLLQAKFDNSVI